MKKLITLIMVSLLFFSSAYSIKAEGKSIEKLNNVGQIDNSNEICQVIYEGKQSIVFYGENGIDIISSDSKTHLDTLYSVLKLICVNDVNNDGYPDFLTYQNAASTSNQMFTISGKDGSVISSFRLTCSDYDENLGTVLKNSYIYKMEVLDNRTFVIYDYTIAEIDLVTGTVIASYTSTDNIWDMLWYQGYIAFVDQDGYFGLLNGQDLSLVEKTKVASERTVTAPYNEEYSFKVQLNLWDLFEYKDKLYFISEDGIIYQYDSDSKTYPQYPLDVVDQEVLDLFLYDNNFGNTTIQTGINNSWFNSYQVVDIKDNMALIKCFFVDNESISEYLSRECQCFVLYDLETMEVVKTIDFKSIASRANGVFSQYTKDGVIHNTITITYPSNEKIATKVIDYNGEVLFQKELKISSSENSKTKLTYLENGGYLLEVFNDCVYEIDNGFTNATPLFVRRKANLINSANDQLVITFKNNEAITSIVAYQSDGKTVNWQYNVREQRIHGAKSVTAADFNKDGIDDYIVLLDNYNSKDEPVDTTVLILNGKDGSTLKDSRIFLYKGYDEKGKYVSYYALVDEVKLVNDMDGDGKRELLISQGIVASSSLSLKGNINNYFDTKGTIKEMGDINSDGVVDYVSISDSQMELWTSKVYSRYDVEYKKYKTKKIDSKIKNSIYGIVFNDINKDGINEIVLSNYNEREYQVFNVYDGKSLDFMYTLCQKGASDYEVFGVLDFDINNDGYNELLRYAGYYGTYRIVDGKTGKELTAFDYWSLDNYQVEDYEMNYKPIEPVYFNISESNELNKLFLFNDVNGDDNKDLAIIKNYWDENTYKTVSVIAIYDTESFEVLETIGINSSSKSEINEISRVKNSDNFLLFNTYEANSVGLFDINEKKEVAYYNINALDGYMINDNTLLASGMENLYLLNTDEGLKLTSESEIISDNHVVTLSWETNQPYSSVKISDNNVVVATTTADSYQLELTEGDHVIVLSCDDGQGKTTIQKVNITVTKQIRGGYYAVVISVLVFVLAVFVNMYRKYRIKKLSKEVKVNG